ncbi:hypothetical protein [uncultured Thermomonospora sp.]|uniref:hypothetical protein n=1 Tax=uncultured Thermomonospora sp. TaxID=671175 RepID=UPI00259B4A10|nr:hypothetical protein [uncultured Thermomonospora sp.]
MTIKFRRYPEGDLRHDTDLPDVPRVGEHVAIGDVVYEVTGVIWGPLDEPEPSITVRPR